MTVVLGDPAHDAERFRLTVPDDVTVVESLQGVIGYLDTHEDEDLVIVGPDAPLAVATDIAEKYRVERPTLGVLVLRRRLELVSMTEALRSGVREVVGADDAEALLQACTRSRHLSRQLRHSDIRKDGHKRGKVILVFSAKGGCGKTTLATNLAESLALLGHGRVCLADFNLEFGDVAIALQVEPARTISDALGMQGGLDSQGVQSMVIHYKDALDVLLAPTQPADAEFITPELTAEVLGLLADAYDYVVIDSPPAFNDVVLKCFDLADSYVLLTTLDMLALKNFKVTLDTLDALGYPRTRWTVVLNRCDSRVGLSPDDMEKVIGIPIATRLPSTKDVPASLNRGVTLSASMPRHPFSRAVGELARLEAGDQAAPAGPSRGRTHFPLFRAASA